MELLVTTVIRLCRALTGRSLKPTVVRLVHRRSTGSSELEKFFGCRIDFGEDIDEVVFDKKAAQIILIGADPYLNKILLDSCEQALAHRRSNASSLRVMVENAITPLLPHGKARLEVVARTLGMSSRTLARRLTGEGLRFGEILNQLRSDLAMHYLQERELSISQIAWLVGYQGVGTFSHRCKRWTGINPKRMRDKLVPIAETSDEGQARISGR
jgi:AraC-like DNA-binding protein